jgi:hypothetical protein
MLPSLACLGACGSDVPGVRACEDELVELVRIETPRDLAEAPPAKHVRRLEIVGSELETLAGLECVEWVETLRIEDNSRLRDLKGLEGLVEVAAERCDEPWATAGCTTYSNSHPPFDIPLGIGDAIIIGNPRLESMAGLDSLASVHVAMEIRDNTSLVSLDGLQSLAQVASYGHGFIGPNGAQLHRSALRIEQNPNLERLDALVSYVGYRLEVRDNARLTHLIPPRVSYPSYSGGLSALVLEDLPRLTTLDGFTDWSLGWLELRRVPLVEEFPRLYTDPDPDNWYMERLVLDSDAALRSIAGLSPVTGIAGQLIIRDNDALQGLTGLEYLEWVAGEQYDGHLLESEHAVLIEGNAVLRNLDALDPTIDGSFEGHLSGNISAIRYNPLLPTCLVQQFLDEIYPVPGEGIMSWEVEGNGEGSCP